MRYADDFVVLARYQTPRLKGWIEEKIETWLKLEINPEKTRVVDRRKDKTSLDFLGYTFRWDRDLYVSGKRYLNVEPSKKSVMKERERINELTDRLSVAGRRDLLRALPGGCTKDCVNAVLRQ